MSSSWRSRPGSEQCGETPHLRGGAVPALAAHLDQVEHFAQRADFAKASAHLELLRSHIDGCGSAADNDDWLVDCTAQLEIRMLFDLLAANL